MINFRELMTQKRWDRIKRKYKKHRYKSGKTTTLYVRNLDADVRDQFKGYCARLGLSMTEVIEQFMAEFSRAIKRKEKIDPKLEEELKRIGD